MAALDDDSNDQLDAFIHSYSYSDCGSLTHPSDEDEDDSCSDSGSEPSEDLDEAEDMAFYDLYDNSTRPSPQPPASPLLEDARHELDSLLDNMSRDTKSAPRDGHKHTYGTLSPSRGKQNEGGPMPDIVVVEEDSSESGLDSNDDDDADDERSAR